MECVDEETKRAKALRNRKLSKLCYDMVHDLKFATLVEKIVKSMKIE